MVCWLDGYVVCWLDGWLARRVCCLLVRCLVGWLDGYVVCLLDGWLDGYVFVC